MPYRTAAGVKALDVLILRLEAVSKDDEHPEVVMETINEHLRTLSGITAWASLEEVPEKPPAVLSDFVYLPPDTVAGIMAEGQGYLDLAREVLNGVEPITYVAGLLHELARRL
jgi:hypothetical protein